MVKPDGLRKALGIGSRNTGEGLAVGFARSGTTAFYKRAAPYLLEGLGGGSLEVLAERSASSVTWRLPILGMA